MSRKSCHYFRFDNYNYLLPGPGLASACLVYLAVHPAAESLLVPRNIEVFKTFFPSFVSVRISRIFLAMPLFFHFGQGI